MENGNGNSMVMPVAPYYGGNGGGGFGFGDAGSGWWIILLLLCLGGGWGNGFGFGGNAGGFVGADVQRGFDQASLVSGISGVQNAITSGFGDVQTALCGGFAGVNSNIANGFAQSEIAANARQMANMQQTFALQSAMSDCCCENRLATANQTATILAEHCADRQVLSDGVRDILANQNNGIQRILDQMCADKIDAKNERIADLERQITALNSNNYIQNALTAQTQFFVTRYPVPTTAAPAA